MVEHAHIHEPLERVRQGCRMPQVLLVGLLVAGVLWPVRVCASKDDQADMKGLISLSLEELMDVEVTLVSRKEEALFETAAAVFVLTRDDLRRSGATTIPDALRLVPGMDVARIDANKWAVSIRGFNDRFARKMLVLIDGRSAYTPIFSGVSWEVQDALFEDIERIEVIRGPGATLWGANAVNGIINVVTRDAFETQGGVLTGGGGGEERGFTALRYGGKMGGQGVYRLYAKGFAHDRFTDASGEPGNDVWRMLRTGFRADWKRPEGSALTLQGDLYAGEAGQTFRVPTFAEPHVRLVADDTELRGGNLLTRWERAFSTRSDLRLQAYLDREWRSDIVARVNRSTYDLDFQHRFVWSDRQEWAWGLGYRLATDTTDGSTKIWFEPASRTTHLFGAFLQDEIELVADRLRLNFGSKFEHNSYSGFEYQPNVRLLWKPGSWQALWVSATRAVRTPARADDDVRLVAGIFPTDDLLSGMPVDGSLSRVIINGSPDFQAEELLSLEAGYRFRPLEWLFVDVAAFYNDYDELRTGMDALPYFREEADPPHLVFELPISNLMEGKAYGMELAAEWELAEKLGRLRAAYTYLKVDLELRPGANPESAFVEMGSPDHQLYVWASLYPFADLRLDGIVRYVGSLPRHGEDHPVSLPLARTPSKEIDGYGELDIRLSRHFHTGLEISLVGRNLLAARHPEYADFFLDTAPGEIQRDLYGALTWRF